MHDTILHVLNSNSFSGAEHVVCNIAKHMRTRYPDQRHLYASPEGPIRHHLERENIPFLPLSGVTPRVLAHVAQACDAKVVHAHDFTASVASALGVRRPILSHLHNNPPWIQDINARTVSYALCSRAFSRIIGVSDAVFDEFYFSRTLRKKGIVLRNVIDIEHLQTLACEKKSATYDVVFLGRLTEQKDPLRFISLMQSVSQVIPTVRAAMIGNGDLHASCVAAVKGKQGDFAIDLLGFEENPYPWVQAAKVLCIPSKWEGFGLVAMEALALGTPVVASRAGALPSIVDDTCGCSCAEDHIFVQEIVKLLTDPAYHAHKSTAAIKRAFQQNDMAGYCCKLYSLYQQALGRHAKM